jgi:predicted GIY-YIG superfamily endonuclease
MNKHTTTVYLIHFGRKLGNPASSRGQAQHYIGFAEHDLAARLERHHAGNGSRIMAAVTKAGIPWVLARTWEGGSRELERTLKSRKQASAFCPVCRGEMSVPTRRPGRRPMAERPVSFYR